MMIDIWFVGIGAVMILSGMVWALRNLHSNTPIALMAAGTFLIMISSAFAHDHNRPALDSWYESLKNENGMACCGGPKIDATTLEEIDWETKNGKYRVRIHGIWVDVPDEAVIKPPNLDGRTLVWPIIYWDGGTIREIKIRCFMPGMMT